MLFQHVLAVLVQAVLAVHVVAVLAGNLMVLILNMHSGPRKLEMAT